MSKSGDGAVIPILNLTLSFLEKVLDILGSISRKIAIGIGNSTPYGWSATGVYFRSGASDDVLPYNVRPKKAAIYTARKTSWPAARGAVGVLCYYIAQKKRSLCVMFSVPYDYNLYSNWWNVKLVEGKVYPTYSLYREMYYGNPFKGDNR